MSCLKQVTDGRPTRANWTKDDRLVEARRRHFEQRNLRVREGVVVEEIVVSHGLTCALVLLVRMWF